MDITRNVGRHTDDMRSFVSAERPLWVLGRVDELSAMVDWWTTMGSDHDGITKDLAIVAKWLR